MIDIDTLLVMRTSPDVGTFVFRSDSSAPVKDLPLFDNRHEACRAGHELPSRKKKLNEEGDPGLRTINMGALLTLLTALLLDMVKIRLPSRDFHLCKCPDAFQKAISTT